MWTRREVKKKGKAAFFAGYWKFVLVAIIITFIGGAAGASSGSAGSQIGSFGNAFGRGSSLEDEEYAVSDEDMDALEEAIENIKPEININGNDINLGDKQTQAVIGTAVAGIVIAAVIIFTIVGLIAGAVSIAIDIFLYNPIEYGCLKFTKKSQGENTALSTIFNGFKDGYKNIVKVMFFRDLYIFLWSLLFVIPGIVKAYQYRMVPYLLSENPEMTKDEALKASSAMMDGQKWRTFVLDLSFIGWHILSLFTFGMLSIFFVNPYQVSTNAALYEALKAEQNSSVTPASIEG